MIEILTSGMPNLVQDLGRADYLSLGVSRAGALDTLSLSLANLALGNEAGAAGLEISLFPFRLRFLQDSAFCCTGAVCPLSLDGVPLPPWWCSSVKAGQVLRIDPPTLGARATLALAGGVLVPELLGSRSTDLKTGFGGMDGRGLQRGDRLPLGTSAVAGRSGFGIAPGEVADYWDQLATGSVTVSVIPAAEYDDFTEESHRHFETSPYQITSDVSRQGYRLQGSSLTLRQPLELLSHGIVPGTVQVPPSGQPIIQLAEANTCGGYPKIATVIAADLWKLGQARPGTRLRFRCVEMTAAVAALRLRQALFERVSSQFLSASKISR